MRRPWILARRRGQRDLRLGPGQQQPPPWQASERPPPGSLGGASLGDPGARGASRSWSCSPSAQHAGIVLRWTIPAGDRRWSVGALIREGLREAEIRDLKHSQVSHRCAFGDVLARREAIHGACWEAAQVRFLAEPEDVRGLDVLMQDALAVQVADTECDLQAVSLEVGIELLRSSDQLV